MPFKSASTRHKKIAGDFGEILTLYLLSKYGFETAKIDHTGIDILAFDKKNKKRLGISVKTRTRSEKLPDAGVGVRGEEYNKIKNACEFFEAEPWISFVVDKPIENKIFCFLMSLETLNKYYPKFRKNKGYSWSMRNTRIDKYKADNDIFFVEFSYRNDRWIGVTH